MVGTTDLCSMDATDLLQGYATRRFSPVDVLEAVLARTEELNPRYNAFFHLMAEDALALAAQSEKRWFAGLPTGTLDGVPVSIKDSIAAEGTPMWRGARAYKDGPPSAYDSPPAARLKEAGALLFGKTTMPDFGMFGAGVSTAHGITRNPWNTAFNTGGSSSGGGAALAARLGPLAVGSDIGGSLRLPAALCGLATLKPTQGRVPHLPPSPLRTAGPMARTVRDVALMLTVLSRPDLRDYGGLAPEGIAYEQHLGLGFRGRRIGLLLDVGYGEPAEPAVRRSVEAAAQAFAAAGAEVQMMGPLLDADPSEALDRIFSVRSRIELDHLPPEKRESVHPLVRRLCERADAFTAMDYGAASDLLERAKATIVARTSLYDYVLSPVLPVVNFPANEVAFRPDAPMSVTTFTAMFNQTGQPAASLCCGFDERGLPIGLQIIGRRFDDIGVLALAQAYEELRGFTPHWPT